jgi:RNA polymerase sigma-70 factor (ECF subfamily)
VLEIDQVAALPEPAAAGKAAEGASRDEQFAALVRNHSRFLFQVAYAVLRNPHDAEDAVQQLFLKLYRSRRWGDWENERAFLARAVWRLAVGRSPTRSEKSLEGAEIPAVGEDPEQAAISADRNALVARLIGALPEELRQPLALSTVEEMTSQQIAAVMGIPEATVRGRLMRARQILKEKLAAYAR